MVEAVPRRTLRTVAVAVAVVAVCAGVLPAGPARAATGTLRQDFNGDGYGDLAVAAPDATVNGKAEAGYVAVLYGSANGLRGTAAKVYTQASAGVPGTVEAGDRFGSDLVTADLDGDGYTDLQVSADDERWEQGGIAREGSRTVLWGGQGGFTSGKVRPAVGDGRYQSGAGTVTGDFNGDGHQDLLDNGRVEYGPFGRDGVPAGTTGVQLVDGDIQLVKVVTGDVDGDGITDVVTLAQSFDDDDEGNHGEHLNFLRGSRDGLRPLVVLRDAQGERISPDHTLAIGDVNGDHRGDIVMGYGRLRFIYGTVNGPADSVAPRTITQDTPGMPGADEPEDVLGLDLAVGDVNGDGYGDVLAGDPFEDLGTVKQAGAFVVVPGGPDGPTGAGGTLLSQSSADVPGTAEKGDRFGERVHLVDGNGDGRAEPVVAAIGEDSYAGGVWVFRSGSAGVTAKGSFAFGARTLGTVASGARLGDRFPR
ncbi:FG-GAP repeat-containing protein [Streptomyces sp. cf386]|uniref:integrin alpha n=1 Tax=Streptomyces sp. cf386 TaxID=1761904 RepID=UPI00088C1106|nr:integrin alpha [Streptomyces sp. cf386]SDO86389.1 FG-GAP repeat-containing protein [Streptomyces sp. cf386]